MSAVSRSIAACATPYGVLKRYCAPPVEEICTISPCCASTMIGATSDAITYDERTPTFMCASNSAIGRS